jgi:hypothetical protein
VSDEPLTKEQVILRSVWRALTGVVEDTAVAPGLKHPLKDGTREDVDDCFRLIEEREKELALSMSRADGLSDPAPESGEDPRPSGAG